MCFNRMPPSCWVSNNFEHLTSGSEWVKLRKDINRCCAKPMGTISIHVSILFWKDLRWLKNTLCAPGSPGSFFFMEPLDHQSPHHLHGQVARDAVHFATALLCCSFASPKNSAQICWSSWSPKRNPKRHHLDHKGLPDWTNLIPMDSHFVQTNV